MGVIMIKLLTAYTTEVDDIDDALAEILEQIDLSALSKHSVGIISCYYEFIELGLVKALCEKLPFDVIGLTTMVSAVPGGYDIYQLSLAVLTSDDTSFETGFTPHLTRESFDKDIAETYRTIKARRSEEPAFILTSFPFRNDLSPAEILKSLDTACGSIPICGSVVSDITMTFDHAKALRNGEAQKYGLAMILVYGKDLPEFFVTAIPDRNIGKRKAIITKSEGYLIKEANDMPIKDYFESIGFAVQDGVNAASVPMMLDYGDGSGPVALTIIFNEDGSAVCAGEAPAGASFSIGEIDNEGIIETAAATVEAALKSGRTGGLLMFPCVSRYMMLSPNSNDEIKKVLETNTGKLPMWLTYSGGEICPVRDENGKLHNRFHNYTFTICAL
jgi:hypothetical protein